MAGQDCRRPAMLEEEVCRQKVRHAPAREEQCNDCVAAHGGPVARAPSSGG